MSNVTSTHRDAVPKVAQTIDTAIRKLDSYGGAEPSLEGAGDGDGGGGFGSNFQNFFDEVSRYTGDISSLYNGITGGTNGTASQPAANTAAPSSGGIFDSISKTALMIGAAVVVVVILFVFLKGK